MSKLKYIIIVFCFLQLISIQLKADKFQVESFTKDEKDIAARKAELKDINDDYCAIIKVRTNVDGILFKTYPDITKIEYKTNPKEIWLYVSPGIKLITMSGTGFVTQEYVIPNSIKVESLSVYVMVVNGVYDFTGVNTNDFANCGVITDIRDGNSYQTVLIGEQCWMAENLAYLPSVVGPGTESESTPYYYVYGYDGTNVTDAKATSNYTTYGVLYNWPAAMAGSASSNANPSGVQGVCPAGWHLPSAAEWTELTDYLGGKSVAGGKLKETGTTHWASPNTGANNESGFTALPGGYRSNSGVFGDIRYYGYWWSSTELYANDAWYRYLGYDISNVYRGNFYKSMGFSVRCLRD